MIVLVALLALLFAGLRFYGLGDAPVSMDEAFTAYYAALPRDQIAAFVAANDVHPPLYFFLVNLLPFGTDAVGLRIPAALASAAALPLIYLAGAQFGAAGQTGRSRLAGLAAMTLAGFATMQISYAQEGRAYGVLILGFALVLVGVTWMLRHRDAAGRPFWTARGAAALPALGALVIGLLALVWSHNVGTVYAGAIGLALILFWVTVLGAGGGAFINLAAAAGLVVVGWYPQLATLLAQWNSVSGGYWIAPPTAVHLVEIFLQVWGDADSPREFRVHEWALAVMVVGFAAWGLWRIARARALGQLVVALGFLGGTAACLIAVTYLLQPILLDRTALALSVPWFVLAGAGLAAVPRPGTRAVMWAGSAALGMFGVVDYFRTGPREVASWPRLLAAVESNSAGRPLIITIPNSAGVALDYYLSRSQADIDVMSLPGPFPTRSADGWYPTGWPGVPAVTAESLTEADARIQAASGDVWLLLRGYWAYDPQALVRAHFDRSYCYQPLYVPKADYFFMLKLVPLSTADGTGCTSFEPNEHYPFRKPGPGLIAWSDALP